MNEQDTKYQGWTNYETWCVALHLDNTRESYQRSRNDAQAAFERAPSTKRVTECGWTVREAAQSELATLLCDAVESEQPTLNGMFHDLLNGALSQVNWSEIAASILSEIESDRSGDTR
ncbi:MAG TPA: hypothetical protein VFE46_01750 [Pirellulales bacterium]|jgi:hypothetical protein|nr:hypothetical protein [Pirellulales bacterium]